jgi:hypothetical protein
MRKALLLWFIPCLCSAQSTYFETVFGTAGNDVSRSVRQLSSGSIYVLGNSDSSMYGGTDVTLTKLDVHGNELWTMYYGTALNENGFYLNTTTDGNFVLAAERENSAGNLDVLVYKVDTSGSVLWSYMYATPVNETVRYIEQTSDGGYILAGSQNDAGGLYDMLALKLDAGGNYQWHQVYGRTDNDYADMIHQVGSDYILTGDTKSYGAGGYDVILYSIDSMGIEIWSDTYGDSVQNGCQGLLLTSDGNYLSYGETEIYPASPFQFYLEKIDVSGNSLWRKTFGGTGADAVFSVREDPDGGFVCTGYSNSYNSGAPLDLVIFKTDTAGNFLWEQTYGGPGIDIGYEIIHSFDGNGFIITGKRYNAGEDYYLLHLDAYGTLSEMNENTGNEALFDIFPAPSEGAFSVRYRLDLNAPEKMLVIRNALGQKIRTVSLPGSEGLLQLDFGDAAAGFYFCSLLSGGKIAATKKIMITGK